MEILILLMYLLFFLIGDFLGKNANKNNIGLEVIKDNICLTRSALFSIFMVLAIGIYFNNIANSTMSLLILGLGFGFEKGQGKFAADSWKINS